MRLPWSKVYRAFPELDRFEEADCERFVRLARARFGREAGPVVLLQIVVTAISVIIASGIAIRWFLSTEMTWPAVVSTVPSAMLIGASLLPALFIRDFWLRSILRRHIGNVQCAGCGYSLLGLPVRPGAVSAGSIRCPECVAIGSRVDVRCGRCGYILAGLPEVLPIPKGGTVLCPECGKVTDLDERGLTAADLLSEPRWQ